VSFARRPRAFGEAIGRARQQVIPATLLAAVQAAWPRVAGEAVTAQAEPVTERNGVVTVACRSATWAQELDLLQGELLERLNSELEERAADGAEAGRGTSHTGPMAAERAGPRVERLRFTADAARHER
jgi:predicted nucleic acid-binding Zn ribbon protein